MGRLRGAGGASAFFIKTETPQDVSQFQENETPLKSHKTQFERDQPAIPLARYADGRQQKTDMQ